MKMSVTPGILTGRGIRLLVLFPAAVTAGASHLVACLEASTSGRKASFPRRSCTAWNSLQAEERFSRTQ